jgi:hypothetical protein
MRDIMGWIMTSARPDILQIPDWVFFFFFDTNEREPSLQGETYNRPQPKRPGGNGTRGGSDWVLGRWAGLPRPWGLLGHMRHPYGHRPATSGLRKTTSQEGT